VRIELDIAFAKNSQDADGVQPPVAPVRGEVQHEAASICSACRYMSDIVQQERCLLVLDGERRGLNRSAAHGQAGRSIGTNLDPR
jgi:hypothetical protein